MDAGRYNCKRFGNTTYGQSGLFGLLTGESRINDLIKPTIICLSVEKKSKILHLVAEKVIPLSVRYSLQVGGIGISPGGNINFITGKAIFEATHGTAPKYAGQDKVNPGSVILSGEMMFRYIQWHEAADIIVASMNKTINQKRVTYDFERLMKGATLLKCSEFGDALIQNM